jgi:hypothetical protein
MENRQGTKLQCSAIAALDSAARVRVIRSMTAAFILLSRRSRVAGRLTSYLAAWALWAFASQTAAASDIVWTVENPFRLYKSERSFRLHEDAFAAVRGAADAPLPADIIERIERCLNDPHSGGTGGGPCLVRARERSRSIEDRLGWAAHTASDICYDANARPRRYAEVCERQGGGRQTARENLILPSAHAVRVELSDALKQRAGQGTCTWRWRPRAGGAPTEQTRRCDQSVLIARVPYSTNSDASGVALDVALPDGRTVSETIVVQDLLVAALGDSFSSGEGNPDRPITWSDSRAMDYRAPLSEAATASMDGRGKGRVRRPPIAGDARSYDPYVLPRRLLEDEENGLQYNPRTEQFRQAFWARSATWLSPDCHRSQYAYPFRVAMQLALEGRHRAVTLVHLSCSGADVANGLFGSLDAREHYDASPRKTRQVPAQFEQLTNLLCRSDARVGRDYQLPLYEPGSARIAQGGVAMRWCPPEQRKREIDLVLLSIGGNDVGFSAIAAYAFLESAGDIASVVKLREGRIRFGPDLAGLYLQQLDERMEQVRRALADGFGIAPSRVVQTSYEALQFDENGRFCGAEAGSGRLGMDVHAKFALEPARVAQVGGFYDRFLKRLECVSARGANCPAGLSTGEGTGFHLVTEHQPAFLRRGICARDPGDDGSRMQMPRIPIGQTEFAPQLPGEFRPYAFRTRLFRTPNDAFLTAHTHATPPMPLLDIIQPAVAALYGGAFHPTAQAHAIVADRVMPYARRVVGERR